MVDKINDTVRDLVMPLDKAKLQGSTLTYKKSKTATMTKLEIIQAIKELREQLADLKATETTDTSEVQVVDADAVEGVE